MDVCLGCVVWVSVQGKGKGDKGKGKEVGTLKTGSPVKKSQAQAGEHASCLKGRQSYSLVR